MGLIIQDSPACDWLIGPWGFWASHHLGITKRKICKNDLCQRYGEVFCEDMLSKGWGIWQKRMRIHDDTVDGCDSSESPVENGGKHPIIYRLSTIQSGGFPDFAGPSTVWWYSQSKTWQSCGKTDSSKTHQDGPKPTIGRLLIHDGVLAILVEKYLTPHTQLKIDFFWISEIKLLIHDDRVCKLDLAT